MGVGATGLNGTNAGDRSEGGEPEKQGDRGEAAGQSTGRAIPMLGPWWALRSPSVSRQGSGHRGTEADGRHLDRHRRPRRCSGSGAPWPTQGARAAPPQLERRPAAPTGAAVARPRRPRGSLRFQLESTASQVMSGNGVAEHRPGW